MKNHAEKPQLKRGHGMGLSVYNIKKWYKMLTGNSIMHVNSRHGKMFCSGQIRRLF